MVRLRGERYLSCFYCGKRSSIKFDGFISEFLCKNCDATNYLDENGEITDPPVIESATPKQFAKPQTQLPPASDSIFCDTCLKNQRLFTASLAQYLPDDPSHPDYEELERKYYRYRKDLEKRYPQACADCAQQVESRIRQAGYTAKTDHLRRMVEKSRGKRVSKKTTPLDLVSHAGRLLWLGGFVLQMLWHLVNIARVLERRDNGMYDPDDQSTLVMVTTGMNTAARFLPCPETLLRWSITAGFLCAWWNPHFVQVNRGFTRHLLGFTQWYSFQGLIIFLRFLFRTVADMHVDEAQSKSAYLSVHVAMAALMGLVYSLARSSIRVDATPLFGPSERTLSSQASSPARRRVEEPKTLAEQLNDALDSAKTTPQRQPFVRQQLSPLPAYGLTAQPPQSTYQNTGNSFASLSSSQPQIETPPASYDADEMDWSPVQSSSQHRAFQTSAATEAGGRPFGQSPAQPDASPFWYKVPAAPVNPARRLRNPPNAPLIRQQQPREDGGMGFRRRRVEQNEVQNEDGAKIDGIDFKQPSFFAPEQHDEASALADVFGQAFNLSQEKEEENSSHGQSGPNSSMWKVNVNAGGGRATHTYQPRTLAVLLPVWLSLSFTSLPYGMAIQLATLTIAGIIALRSMGDTSRVLDKKQGPLGLVPYIISAMNVAELAAVCWVAWELWAGQTDVRWYGTGALGLMLGHEVWNHFS